MSDVLAIFAVVISVIAALVTYWQTKLVRQSIEAQTFTTLLERAREIDISSALDFIGTLNYTDYNKFVKSVPAKKRAQIRAVVDFFNDLSHMMRSGYVDDFYPIRIYYPGLILCNRKLLQWWIIGIRKTRSPSLYNNFKWLCEYSAFLETKMKENKLKRVPQIGYREYLKSQGKTKNSVDLF